MQMLDSLDKFNIYGSVCTNLDGLNGVDKLGFHMSLFSLFKTAVNGNFI